MSPDQRPEPTCAVKLDDDLRKDQFLERNDRQWESLGLPLLGDASEEGGTGCTVVRSFPVLWGDIIDESAAL